MLKENAIHLHFKACQDTPLAVTVQTSSMKLHPEGQNFNPNCLVSFVQFSPLTHVLFFLSDTHRHKLLLSCISYCTTFILLYKLSSWGPAKCPHTVKIVFIDTVFIEPFSPNLSASSIADGNLLSSK